MPPPSPPAPLTSPQSLPTNRLFRLTSASYNQDSDFGACAAEFGRNYRTADWDDLLSIPAAHMSSMLDGLGLRHYDDGALLTRHGSPTDNSWRRWFTARHDGHPPASWYVADQHGGLTLGGTVEWRDRMAGPWLVSVMCVYQLRASSPPSPSPPPSPPAPLTLPPSLPTNRLFRLTSASYNQDSDFGYAEACTNEFGHNYRTADWDDLLSIPAAHMSAMLDGIGLFAPDGALLTRHGSPTDARPRPAYNTGPLPLAATDEYASKGPLPVAVLVPVDEYARKTLV